MADSWEDDDADVTLPGAAAPAAWDDEEEEEDLANNDPPPKPPPAPPPPTPPPMIPPRPPGIPRTALTLQASQQHFSTSVDISGSGCPGFLTSMSSSTRKHIFWHPSYTNPTPCSGGLVKLTVVRCSSNSQ